MLEEMSKTSKFKIKKIYLKFKEKLNTKEKMNLKNNFIEMTLYLLEIFQKKY